MLVKDNEIQKYLEDFHEGRIKQGLGIGCKLDDYLRFKPSALNIILGHDNVGKTYWRTWYYLCLTKHNLKFAIWTGENKAGQIVRNLIQQYTGKRLKDLSMSEVLRYQQEIGQYFHFVDNSKLWKAEELLKIFKEEGVNGALIDPYTGLDRGYSHSDNYEFLNKSRQWTNETGITLDVCTHPISQSGRSGGMYPQGHEWEGHLRSPYKADTEGGKPFQNRCDDFIILHRLTKHPTMWSYTLVSVDKIKDHETGGNLTQFNEYILCEFNKGLGFKIEGVNPLTDKPVEQKEIDLTKTTEAIVKARMKEEIELDIKFKKDDDEDDIPF